MAQECLVFRNDALERCEDLWASEDTAAGNFICVVENAVEQMDFRFWVRAAWFK